jgi:two-component system, NarL family, sensor kinase
MKKILTILWVVFILFPLKGYVYGGYQKDSLNLPFIHLPDNTCKVDSLLRYMLGNKDSVSEDILFKETLRSAMAIHYQNGIILAYDQIGVAKRNQSNYVAALTYHKKALEIAEKQGNRKLEMQVLNNIGVVYRRLDETRLALDFHMRALKIAEELKDTKNICISINSIGNIYLSLDQGQTAMTFFKKALLLERGRGNLWGVAINLHNIGAVYESLESLDSAMFYYKSSLYYDLQAKKKAGVAICYNSIGEVFLKKKEYEKAVYYFNLALKINEKIGDRIYISVSFTDIANAFLLKSEYDKALEYFRKGLDIALNIRSKYQAQVAYEGFSKCYQSLGKFEKALDCYKNAVAYADSITNENNVRHITLIQAQYDTEKQHQQIKLLEKEKEASQLFIILLTILVLVVVLFSLLSYRNILQKRKIGRQELDLKEQKIRELEKDHQLFATQLVLQGEEAERSRLSRDLHDGLGGLLSGVKLTLSNMKGSMVLSSENVNEFDKALYLLDSSMTELRRVAHNMMPEALVKFGLKDALSDFCSSINNKRMEINFQFFGEENRIDNKLEIGIYRIAQELVNNALKYSLANQLLVQLVQEENRINLTVQDNGKGFDTDLLHVSKGAGIVNIRSRVESLNGRFDLYSEPDNGTEASVEFQI